MNLNIKRPQVNPCHMSTPDQCIAQVGADADCGGYLFVKCDGIMDGEVHWMWRVFDNDMIQVARSDQGENNSIRTPLGIPKSPIEVMTMFCEFLAATTDNSDSLSQEYLRPLHDWIGWNRDELEILSNDMDEHYELSSE